MATIVADKIVSGGPKPWPFPYKDHLNVSIITETEDETRWYGSTIVSQARPVQVAFNASWSSVIEHMKLAGNARLATPTSALEYAEHFTDLPGSIAPYPDGTTVPAWVSPPQMPAWWVEEPARLREELDDIMGVHDISRGEAPTNIESGYGLSVLAEQDTTPVGKLVKSTAIAFSQLASDVLELYRSEVKHNRQAVVRTPSQPPETAEWTGKSLAGQTRALVPLEAIVPKNRAAQEAMAQKLVEMGLVTSFEQFATVAELPDHRRILDRVEPDIARARRENHLMALGQVALPYEWDDHDKHIEEHNNFRKSARYETLDEAGKALFADHVQAHSTMAAEEMGSARAAIAVDPLMAAVPQPDGRTILGAEEVPLGATPATLPNPGDQPLPAEPGDTGVAPLPPV